MEPRGIYIWVYIDIRVHGSARFLREIQKSSYSMSEYVLVASSNL